VDVGHHVVAEPLLVAPHRVQVDVVQVGAHLSERGIGNVEAEALLLLGQGEPQAAPDAGPLLGTPQALHHGRRVA
jgi:hypothetical protein